MRSGHQGLRGSTLHAGYGDGHGHLDAEAAGDGADADAGADGHIVRQLDLLIAYGVLVNEAVALRGLFLIDPKGLVRHATIVAPALRAPAHAEQHCLFALHPWLH